jgi:hypothetical protein
MATKPARKQKPAAPSPGGTHRKPTPAAPGKARDPVYRRDELARILAEREAWTAAELAENPEVRRAYLGE